MPAPTKPSNVLHTKDSNLKYQLSRYPLCEALYPHVLRLKQMWLSVPGCSSEVKVQFAALLDDAAW